jgi:hypothetical protein
MMGIEHFKKVLLVIGAGIVEMVPAPLKYELRIFGVEYLCFWGGDFASIPPHAVMHPIATSSGAQRKRYKGPVERAVPAAATQLALHQKPAVAGSNCA